MCRIAGIWKQGPSQDLERLCVRMCDTMSRGGPDDSGTYFDRISNVALGHRRLSIIDLSHTGHQPMSTNDGRYTITYNGEIYNYQDLRKELQARGITFRGTSDTEAALQAFAAWGPDCVARFNGMFAFAVWDASDKALYLFRDRMGVKPLYYYRGRDAFAFSSELKALHAGLGGELEIDCDALGEFLHYGYISAPRSIYRRTCKLEPGHWIKISQGNTLEDHVYWSLPDIRGETHLKGTEDACIDGLEEIMSDAFAKRLIADVPVGVFLSGGVDSSLVTAILARNTSAPIKTFTIGFKEKSYDESAWAKKIARHLATEHTEEIVTPDHAKEILPLWPEIYDEPFGDISGIPTTIVSRMTVKHVKVSLSADGGDELFCGYHRYWVMDALRRFVSPLPSIVPRAAGKMFGIIGSDLIADMARAHPKLRLPAIRDRMRKMHAVLANWKGDASSSYPYAVAYWLPHEIHALTGRYTDPREPLDPSAASLLEAMMDWDRRHYLPEDILTKVDRATMFCSLEGRDPFLDHRIVEFAGSLPLDMKYRKGEPKYILKKLLKRYLPEELFARPKQGFAVPIHSWLHDDLSGMVGKYLNPDSLRSQNQLDPGMVMETVSGFQEGKGSAAVDRIWLLLVFMMWKERYSIS